MECVYKLCMKNKTIVDLVKLTHTFVDEKEKLLQLCLHTHNGFLLFSNDYKMSSNAQFDSISELED